MRPCHTFLLLALVLAQLPASAVETVSPESASQAPTLQLGSFYVSPNATLAGEQMEFVAQARSFTNTVTPFSASIYIYGSKGRSVAVLHYANSTIAGGETQTLSRFYDTSGLPIGDYRAFVNATYEGNSTNTKSAQFSIVYSLPYSGNNSSAKENGFDTGIGEVKPVAISCPDFSCTDWGECSDGYRSQDCIHPQGCSNAGFVHVERCNQGPPSGLPLEQPVCSALPQICTTEPQEGGYLCVWLPVLAVSLLFFIVVLRARQKHLRF